MKRDFIFLKIFILLFTASILFSQESDTGSFGFEEEDTGNFGFGNGGAETGSAPALKIGGEISSKLIFFTEGFTSSDKIKKMELGDIFEGKLNFSAGGKAADGIINLKIKPDFSGTSSPIYIDEAFLRVYLGPVDIEGGLRKLTWGRADSFGPLDVINPIDYTDLSVMNDPRSIKLARPMLHITWNINSFSRLEGVFVPWFSGDKFALSGRWAPGQITQILDLLTQGYASDPLMEPLLKLFEKWTSSYDLFGLYLGTSTLEYAQGGMRFSTTLGSSDLGIQYYYGRFFRPSHSIDLPAFLVSVGLGNPDLSTIYLDYNWYHQIGVDYAQVIAGFNLRAELGVNITNDLKGDDGRVYNPQVVWSLGFDRDLIWGINLNLQGNGLFRLLYNKIGNDIFTETEAGKDRTTTRITAILSKKLFQDELEIRTTALWGIEDKDFFIIPAIVWSKNDITAELSMGIFGGDKNGELGHYRDNSYIKTVLTWKF